MAAKQQLPLDELLQVNLRGRELSIRIWFWVSLHLAVKILSDTSFNDKFMCELYPTKRKVVPWHAQAVTILAYKQSPQNRHTWNTISPNPVQAIDRNVFHAAHYSVVRNVRNIVLPPRTQHQVLVAKTSHGIFAIKTKSHANKPSPYARCSRNHVHLTKPTFSILVSNVSI